MVHALDEVRRTLTAGGILIDLRPQLDAWPIEVAWRDGYREAGRATDVAEALGDDSAADAVLGEAIQAGGLLSERAETFSLFYYWDTPSEMEEDIAEDWNDAIRVEQAAWSELRRSWASANAEARVRLRVKMLITRLRTAS